MLTIEECCGPRPAEYPHTEIAADPELHQLLTQLPNDPACDFSLWRCEACGQLWREYWLHGDSMDDPVVVKDGVTPSAFFSAQAMAPQPVAGNDRLPIGDTVGVVGLILGGLGLAVGIVRLPAEYDSLPWKAAWVLGHVAAGVGVAVLMLVMLILRRRSKERA